MKLRYKGDYKGEDQLPKGNLPANAVPFKEPKTPAALNGAALLFLLPALALAAGLMALSRLLTGAFRLQPGLPLLLGMIASFLSILPHELLHGICFGRDAEVELYISLKNMMAFVVSTQPVSKARFIWLSLLPNLVFGWLPLLIWAFVPLPLGFASALFGFGLLCVTMGAGDYLNVWNAARQMPRGSLQQLSGFHSYWFIPEKEERL